jgi:accessory gene regulator B
MINFLATKISKKLVEFDIVEFDDFEVSIYGLEIILSTVFEIGGLVAIGVVLGLLKEVLVFVVFFSTLRIHSGGYHAKTCLKCFLFITMMTLGTIFAVKSLNILQNIFTITTVLIISIIIILKYSPISSPNKEVSIDERNFHRRISIVTVIIQSSIIVIAYLLRKDLTYYCTISSLSIALESITLLIPEKVNN